MENIRTRKL